MQQVVISAPGDASELQLEEAPLPIPIEHQVRIDVKAAGVCFPDIQLRENRFDGHTEYPLVPGFEVSGIVTAVGPEVDENLLGKEVIALNPRGGYSSELVVPKHTLWLKPASMSFEQAAGLPVAYLTAYHALMVMSRLKPSETLLIHNIGGSLGLAMLDLAKRLQPRTIIGTASKGKHAFLMQRGVDHLIDYTDPDVDWVEEVNIITNGKGCEVIVDPIGGDHWKKSYDALRATGRLAMVGLAQTTLRSGNQKSRLALLKSFSQASFFNPVRLIEDNKAVFGVNLATLMPEYEKIRTWMDHILLGYEEGWVQPHIHRVMPLEEAAKAHTYLESRKNIGKIVLAP